MKQKFINISLTFISIIILGVILAITISMLNSFNIISLTLNDNLLLALSLVLFLLLGFVYGLVEKKRGMLNGILLSIIYLIIVYGIKLINKDYQISSVYIIMTRCLLIIVGCIIGVNIRLRHQSKLNP